MTTTTTATPITDEHMAIITVTLFPKESGDAVASVMMIDLFCSKTYHKTA